MEGIAPIYFVVMFTITNYLFLNLLIAIILDNYLEARKISQQRSVDSAVSCRSDGLGSAGVSGRSALQRQKWVK